MAILSGPIPPVPAKVMRMVRELWKAYVMDQRRKTGENAPPVFDNICLLMGSEVHRRAKLERKKAK